MSRTKFFPREIFFLKNQLKKLSDDIQCLETEVDDDSKFVKFIIDDYPFDSLADLIYNKFKEPFFQWDNKFANQIQPFHLNSYFRELKKLIIDKKKNRMSEIEYEIKILQPITPGGQPWNKLITLEIKKNFFTDIKEKDAKDLKKFIDQSLNKLLMTDVDEQEKSFIFTEIKNFEKRIQTLEDSIEKVEEEISKVKDKAKKEVNLSENLMKKQVIDYEKINLEDFCLSDSDEFE